jgi:nitroreductase/FMN reductase [NAD(P)H]
VPDEQLEIALAAALSAPSKSDLQQIAIVLVQDKTKQATMGSWIPDMPWIAQCPLFIVFCGDHRRMRRVSELRGKPFPNDTLDMFMNSAVDAGLVMQNFITAAEGPGLCVGYPAQPGFIGMRLPPAPTAVARRHAARG